AVRLPVRLRGRRRRARGNYRRQRGRPREVGQSRRPRVRDLPARGLGEGGGRREPPVLKRNGAPAPPWALARVELYCRTAFTAASASRYPAPTSHSANPGRGRAVCGRTHAILSGVRRPPAASCISATTPTTWGVAMDVPDAQV